MKNKIRELKNWDNETWLSSSAYINSFNTFLLGHKDVDVGIDFRNEDVFKFFKTNQIKFDLIMIKQTLHFFNKDKRSKLIKICKNNLKKNGVLIIFSLNTLNNEIPCFKLMKQKLNRGLERDSIMIKSTCIILKN